METQIPLKPDRREPVIRELDLGERICMRISDIRNTVAEALYRHGFKYLSRIADCAGNGLTWQIQKSSGFLDMLDNQDFILGLEGFRIKEGVGEDSEVLYLGSGNDTSVRRVFPHVLNVDTREPEQMPDHYNFLQADALSLPQQNESVDLVIIKCLVRNVLESNEFAKEMKRVIKANGSLYIHFPDPREIEGTMIMLNGELGGRQLTGQQIYESNLLPSLQRLDENMHEVGFKRVTEPGNTTAHYKKESA